MRKLKSLAFVLVAFGATCWSGPSPGQTAFRTGNPADWIGTWVAEGTLFTIEVTIDEQEFRVSEVQSLGFVWSAQGGTVDGEQASIEVRYAGATARVLARLAGDGLAVVEASTCTPEFMVVCALVRDRQAVFVRTASN